MSVCLSIVFPFQLKNKKTRGTREVREGSIRTRNNGNGGKDSDVRTKGIKMGRGKVGRIWGRIYYAFLLFLNL